MCLFAWLPEAVLMHRVAALHTHAHTQDSFVKQTVEQMDTVYIYIYIYTYVYVFIYTHCYYYDYDYYYYYYYYYHYYYVDSFGRRGMGMK